MILLSAIGSVGGRGDEGGGRPTNSLSPLEPCIEQRNLKKYNSVTMNTRAIYRFIDLIAEN